MAPPASSTMRRIFRCLHHLHLTRYDTTIEIEIRRRVEYPWNKIRWIKKFSLREKGKRPSIAVNSHMCGRGRRKHGKKNGKWKKKVENASMILKLGQHTRARSLTESLDCTSGSSPFVCGRSHAIRQRARALRCGAVLPRERESRRILKSISWKSVGSSRENQRKRVRERVPA
jgi:hypothetical protein